MFGANCSKRNENVTNSYKYYFPILTIYTRETIQFEHIFTEVRKSKVEMKRQMSRQVSSQDMSLYCNGRAYQFRF